MAQTVNPSSNPLLDYMLGSQGSNTAKTVNDILQGTGLQNTYNTQVAVGNQATQSEGDQLKQILAGPINGQNINPTPIASANNLSMIKDSSMPVNLLLGILSQASQLQQNGNNNAASIYNNQQNNATTQRGQNLQYFGSPSNPSSTSSPIIDHFVTGIMKNQISISAVPEAMRGPVLSALQQQGYDPSKEIWGDVGELQSLWNNGVSEPNPIAKGTGKLDDLLGMLGQQTPGEKAKEQYVAKAQEFASKYSNLLGDKIDLPLVKDSNDVALNKMDNLVNTLRNKLYQGGSAPTAQ